MKISLLSSITLASAVLMSGQTPAAKAPAATKAAAPAAAKAPATGAAAAKAPAAKGGPNLMDPSTMKGRAPEMFRVRFNTTKGPVVLEITRSWAPNGADRFYNLVRAGFFTDAAFFRVVPGFMAQFGISAKPEVSRIWAQNNIPDDPVKSSNTRGRITFAQTSALNSRSAQLFINFGNNTFLDTMRFAPIGEVVEGMAIVDQIYSGYGEKPDQGAITAQGKAYLDASFPMLDRIVTAVVAPMPAAPKPEAKSEEKK